MFFGGDIMDVNVTVKNAVVKIHGIFGLLLVVVVGSVISAPNPHPRPSTQLEGYEPFVNSSASTAEVLRKVHTFMTLTKPLGGKRKWVKQEEEATMGAANALAYLTDSFGGQIAGQVLALILSSVTGDVRGILGNSLNLFQDDERRDRVQIFLDDISKQFLEFTGLASLTTTKKPLQQTTLYPGQIVSLGSTGTGQQGQILALQPASASAVAVPGGVGGSYGSTNGVGSSYGTGISGVGSSYGSATSGVGSSYGTATGGVGGTYGTATGTVGGAYKPIGSLNLQPAQQQQAQKPVIYVLPQLANAGTTGTGTSSSGTSETKTPVNKITSTSSNIGGDDDSEEEERRERERERERD